MLVPVCVVAKHVKEDDGQLVVVRVAASCVQVLGNTHTRDIFETKSVKRMDGWIIRLLCVRW